MNNAVSIGFGGIGSNSKQTREKKGKNLNTFPSDYVVIDIETTGLDPFYNDIIEIGAIKVLKGSIVETYNTLVKPSDMDAIDDFIEDLTGITAEMLLSAPDFSDIVNDFLDFVGDYTLLGHNTNFDINFLYDATNGNLYNDFVDTLKISRRILPELKHHRLPDIADHYQIVAEKNHRALADCETTYYCYTALCNDVLKSYGSFDSYNKFVQKMHAGVNAKDISSTKVEFDVTHSLYGKNCVFTGVLEKCARKDAMQVVVDLGGICQNSVTTKTNYLILGNNDYCPTIKEGKSSKQKKAENLKLQGQDIAIISENVFYDMIFED